MSDRTTRVVPDSEELSIDLLLEKFHQGAIWHGMTELNIGWPEELHISGPNVIHLLTRLRDDSHHALDHHRVPGPEGLTQADRIHLLVGRRSR